MSLRIRLSARALADLDRLPAFLELRSPAAAERVRQVLEEGIGSLGEFPDRGRPTANPAVRELPLKFGRYGYLVRYRSSRSEVFIIRLVHVREAR